MSTNSRPRHVLPGWQPALLTALAGAAAVVAAATDLHSPHLSTRMLCAAGTIAFLVLAMAAVLRGAAWLRGYTRGKLSETHAGVLRIVAVAAGIAVTALIALSLLAVPVGQLLLGGALTGALLGIVGQQTLANLIAGVVLLATRTITVGDRIRLHSGSLGGTFEGTITEIGLIHVHLRTSDAPLTIPNTQVLGAAICVLEPQAALPAAPITRPRRRAIRPTRRQRRISHTTVLRTTQVLPTVDDTRFLDSTRVLPTSSAAEAMPAADATDATQRCVTATTASR
ncbi:mechanosensitive ion channel family protein [Couchioplanes azureus]|uniref:mechanosensitive ion channel family protein n=1 Tax=Couchioplanes caeruleus TaxID=56438 RepID=UPI00166F9727|nr:mechanosensitive ion channel domain-containing protein [Couchioplanes caeruleus]